MGPTDESPQEHFTMNASLPTANTWVDLASFNPTKNVTRLAVAVDYSDDADVSELSLRLIGEVAAGATQVLLTEQDMARFISKGKQYPIRPGVSILQIDLQVDHKTVGVWDGFHFAASRSISDGETSVALTITV